MGHTYDTADLSPHALRRRLREPGVVLTIEEVVAATGLDRGSVRAAMDRDEIPSIRVGRRVLVPLVPFCALFGITDAEEESEDAEQVAG